MRARAGATKLPQGAPKLAQRYADELRALYDKYGGLDPEVVVEWARKHPDSALHGRFEWNNNKAAHEYRLWQARQLITEVNVVYSDGKKRQVYVSPVQQRGKGKGGYVSLVDVLSDEEKRRRYLEQALAEYRRLSEKYSDLKELAEIHAAVKRAVRRKRRA